jgi:O-antigen ligase
MVVTFVVYALRHDLRQGWHFSAGNWIAFTWIAIAMSRPVNYWIHPNLFVSFSQRLAWQRGSIETIQDNPVDRNVLILLMVLGLIILIGRRDRFRIKWLDNSWLIAFFAFCLLGVLWSGYPGISFKRWLRFGGDVIVVLLILTEDDPEESLYQVMRRVAVLFLPLSLLFIKYYGHLGRIYTTYGKQMWVGVAGHKNSLGILCAFTAIVLVWRNLSKWPKVNRVDAGLLALAIYLLIGAKSSTSAMVFTLGSFLLIMESRMKGNIRKLNRIILIGLVSLLIIQVLAISFLNESLAPVFFSAAGRDTSFTGRVPLWQELLEIGGHSPLIGYGFASFWLDGDRVEEIWNRVNWTPTTAHNGYLDIFLDLGIIGLILLFLLLVQTYRGIVRSHENAPGLSQLKVVLFAMAFFHNFTESSFGKPFSPIWLLFLLASIVILRTNPKVAEGGLLP